MKITSVISLLLQCLWPPNWQDGDVLWEAATYKVTQPPYVVLQVSMTNWIRYISTTTRYHVIKLGNVVSYYKGLLCIILHNLLNKWSHEAMWQIKFIIYPLPQSLRPLNVVRCDLKSDSHLPKKFLFIYFNESLLKMMKNAFYFILKALFVLKIFRFLSWPFAHIEETAWLERQG